MAEVKMGGGQSAPTGSTHVPGTKEGNTTGNYEKMPGHRPDGTSTARRSTGVAKGEPIDPSMPNLSPA